MLHHLDAKHLPFILLTIALAGCSAPADPAAKVSGINRQMLTAEKVRLYQISVNGTEPPPGALADVVEYLQPFLRGRFEIEDLKRVALSGNDVPLPLMKFKKQGVSPSLSDVILVYMPTASGVNRGLFTREESGHQQIFFNESGISAMTLALFSRRDAWELVMKHELGHAMGVPSDPSHQWHDGHCTDPHCVMYPTVDGKAILAAVFEFGPPKGFCDKCWDELLRARDEK